MRTNKKIFKLIWLNNGLYFAVKAGSVRAAKDYIYNHMPHKSLKSLLVAYFGEYNCEADDAYNALYFANNFIKTNEYYITKIK